MSRDPASLIALSKHRLTLGRLEQIDNTIASFGAELAASAKISKHLRLAILSSSTTAHLHAAIRVAGLRRGLLIEIYEPGYQQFLQDLLNKQSDLFAFKPNVVLFAFDARFALREFAGTASRDSVDAAMAATLATLRQYWALARDNLDCMVLQQTMLPVFFDTVGQNEQLWPSAPVNVLRELNAELRRVSASENVNLLAVDRAVERDGLDTWYAESYWHRAKQEVAPTAVQLYGDLVGRLLAASYGRSAKCLCLDLDNTLWGGVIGDDGLGGIKLGQGSAEGEAYVDFQSYAKALSKRGIILAVCSKNDEKNAVEPFERHDEMVLRRDDIACFVANWDDKATNLQRIAKTLNIGLDAIVFVDDNPFEREQVRGKLADVIVPEMPDDASLYARCLSDAGFFESIAVTADDLARHEQYRANAQRLASVESMGDLSAYLSSLQMCAVWGGFDPVSIPRVTQLINKTNQFNLTTRRYSQGEVEAFAADPATICLQMRVIDRFGDNGIVVVLIARVEGGIATIDSWLMSCRVIGRRIEEATLALLAREARRLGATRIEGRYLKTEKNGMVRELLPTLGFAPCAAAGRDGDWYALDLQPYVEPDLPIEFKELEAA